MRVVFGFVSGLFASIKAILWIVCRRDQEFQKIRLHQSSSLQGSSVRNGNESSLPCPIPYHQLKYRLVSSPVLAI